jgi:TnpA family transposase
MKHQNDDRTQRRLQILSEDEIEAMYGRPLFNHEDRVHYFSLSPLEKAALKQFHTFQSRIFYIVQLGYFKARRQFFTFSLQDVPADASYVQQTYFPDIPLTDLEVAKGTRLKQQRVILDLFRFRLCKRAERLLLARRAEQAARISSKPIYVLHNLLQYLAEQRIVAPGYTVLQDIVSKALTREQERLIRIADEHLTAADVATLRKLLTNPHGLYEITRLKREPKDFSNEAMAREIRRGEQIAGLYHLAQKLLQFMQISPESVKYYASLVNFYSVFRLQQLDEQLVFIYLLCFVYYRYQQLHDNLLNALLYYVRQYAAAAKQAAKERVYEYRLEQTRDLRKAGHVLKLFTDDAISPQTPFGQVQARAFTILDRQRLDRLAGEITEDETLDETALQWEFVDGKAMRFKLRIRPVLRNVTFSATTDNDPLLEAVDLMKWAFLQKKSLTQFADFLPTYFIPNHVRRYLYGSDALGRKKLLVDRYEFLVYRLLRNGLEAGDIFCHDSVRFRSFEDDLLDEEQWQRKEELIASTGLSILQEPVGEHLDWLEQLLEQRLLEVNRRIASGENKQFRRKRSGRWTLPTPRARTAANHPLFEILPDVNIQTVLGFANRRTRFMDAFEHVLHRYSKTEADDDVISACLLAWGTNMGLGRMGTISDVAYATLADASDNFIRLETLQAANDAVSNATAGLPIFHHYDIGDTVHSSSDGQKFETSLHTINARHSSKYFGLKKGIVAYTLVANHIPINARVIGANEHESHYVFDLLFNNTTEVQPTIHSTDTHGSNPVNFALLHFFGYQFAPRYRDLYDKVRTSLYGFKHPSRYHGLTLKPIRKIQRSLIENEWENIQRILLSLALKTTTQFIIVGKLSAYARKNRTKRALWEYDNIMRSLYLLDYIDSPALRRNVQRALSRGENYHQLRRAVSYANFGKLRFKTEHEQQIWSECSRLLTNCIIYYNAIILSDLLRLKEQQGDARQVTLLEHVSPVAWQHINFHGRFEFRSSQEQIDIAAMVQELARFPIQSIPVSQTLD